MEKNILERVRPQYREVFEYRYKTYATISWIAYQTGYEDDTIYKICDRETERLSNEWFCPKLDSVKGL